MGSSGSSTRRSEPTYFWMTLRALAGASSPQIRSISSAVLTGRPTPARSRASRNACCRGRRPARPHRATAATVRESADAGSQGQAEM
ncbi:hypothetical protein ACFQZ4_45000 [Catellatospora coxensis]